MKKFFSLLFVLFLITACTNQKFEASNTIYPEILSSEDDVIAIQYYLGKLIVLDELRDLNQAEYTYLMKNANKDLQLTLKISYNARTGC